MSRMPGGHCAIVRTTNGVVISLIALIFAGVPAWGQAPGKGLTDKQPEVLSVTLKRFGFFPSLMTINPAYYAIHFTNRSTLDNLTIEVDRMPGSDLAGIPEKRESAGAMTKSKTRWRTVVKLTAGTYRLRVAEHPEWTCKITVR